MFSKRHNLKLWLSLDSAILLVASVTVVYLMSIFYGASILLILALGLTSLAGVVRIAVRMLKDSHSTAKTFDGHFYRDRDDLRSNGKE